MTIWTPHVQNDKQYSLQPRRQYPGGFVYNVMVALAAFLDAQMAIGSLSIIQRFDLHALATLMS